ncbi:MAG: threonine synthase [Halobacteriota archaeon]
MHRSLVCYACGTETETDRIQRCQCGEPLWYRIDPTPFEWPTTVESMWAFESLLPTAAPSSGIARDAGGTPLHRLPAVDGGDARIYVKNEGLNPTGSFKDRGSAVGVTAALERGAGAIATVSHGNMAMSTAAAAAGTALDCYVFVPADIPEQRLVNIGQYDPTIVRVDGPYGELYERSLALAREFDVEFVNSDSPLRTAGQKTTGLEIARAFATDPDRPEMPDAIVLPVSSGGHASATWKGLWELVKAGAIETIPRLYFVQAAGCAPIARAFDSGAGAVTRLSSDETTETIAYSIANADPPSGTRALTVARETGGGVIAVDDDAIREARDRLAKDGGVSVESASATTLAGVEQLSAAGELAVDEHVVVVATGTGFKERRSNGESVRSDRVSIDDLEGVFSA